MLDFVNWLEDIGCPVEDTDLDWNTSATFVDGVAIVTWTTGADGVLSDNKLAKDLYNDYQDRESGDLMGEHMGRNE